MPIAVTVKTDLTWKITKLKHVLTELAIRKQGRETIKHFVKTSSLLSFPGSTSLQRPLLPPSGLHPLCYCHRLCSPFGGATCGAGGRGYDKAVSDSLFSLFVCWVLFGVLFCFVFFPASPSFLLIYSPLVWVCHGLKGYLACRRVEIATIYL